MKKNFERILAKPKLVLGTILFITACFIPFVLKVKPNNSLEANAVKTDPSYYRLMEIEKKFGVSEENLAIAIHSSDSLLEARNLEIIENLRKDLNHIPLVDEVLSITNLKEILVSEDTIEIVPIIPKDKINLTKIEKNKVTQHSIYSPLFISNDEKTSLLFILIKPLGKDNIARSKLLKEIGETVDKFKKEDISIWITGSSYLMHQTNLKIDKDNKTLLPITLGLLALLLYLIYRSPLFVALPFVIAILAITWTIGMMGLLGRDLTAFTALVPLVLLTICLCDAIHILNSFWQETSLAKGTKTKQQMVLTALSLVLLPSILASVDNIIGFLALLTSGMEAIREMGLFVSIGVLFAFLLSITLIPLGLIHLPIQQNHKDIKRLAFFSRGMLFVGKKVVSHPKIICGGILVFFLLCICGLAKVEVGQNLWGMFKGETEMEKANTYFKESHSGASGEIDILLKSQKGFFYKAENLNQIREIEKLLQTSPYHRKSFSLYDALAVIAGKDKEVSLLTQQDVDAGLGLLEIYTDTFFSKREYITEDGSEYRIKEFMVFGDNTKDVLEFEKQLNAQIKEKIPENVDSTLVGRPFIWAHMIHYVVDSQITSFAGSFILISIIMGFLFRSLKIGLITIVVNVLPILAVFGIVGWMGIKLNAFIAMVACVGLGLAVDETLHFVMHYKQSLKAGQPPREAMLISYEYVGFQTVITTALMGIGLSTFAFSGLVSTMEFGLVFSLTCFFSLLVVLFILPPLLFMVKIH